MADDVPATASAAVPADDECDDNLGDLGSDVDENDVGSDVGDDDLDSDDDVVTSQPKEAPLLPPPPPFSRGPYFTAKMREQLHELFREGAVSCQGQALKEVNTSAILSAMNHPAVTADRVQLEWASWTGETSTRAGTKRRKRSKSPSKPPQQKQVGSRRYNQQQAREAKEAEAAKYLAENARRRAEQEREQRSVIETLKRETKRLDEAVQPCECFLQGGAAFLLDDIKACANAFDVAKQVRDATATLVDDKPHLASNVSSIIALGIRAYDVRQSLAKACQLESWAKSFLTHRVASDRPVPALRLQGADEATAKKSGRGKAKEMTTVAQAKQWLKSTFVAQRERLIAGYNKAAALLEGDDAACNGLGIFTRKGNHLDICVAGSRLCPLSRLGEDNKVAENLREELAKLAGVKEARSAYVVSTVEDGNAAASARVSG